jgi:POT family proton-dependent oligopeptide transporter
MFCVGTAILIAGKKFYVVKPPQGTVITDCFKAIGIMIKARNMDAAKPSYQEQLPNGKKVNWDDHFVEELKRSLVACKVFCAYPIYWVCYNQFSTNFVNQCKNSYPYRIFLLTDYSKPNEWTRTSERFHAKL